MTQRHAQLRRVRGRRGGRGFTLIDAVMAIVIAAIALPPMLWAVRDAQKARTEPIMFDRARWLAAEKLEDVIADRHSATRGYTYVISANYAWESPVTGFAGFSRSVKVVETGASLSGAGTGYKTVTVSVTYPASGGSTKTFDLATVLTAYTP